MSAIFGTNRAVGNKPKRLLGLAAIAGLLAGLLVFQATPAHAAAATVANGIVTKDLNAIGVSPTSLAQELAGAGVTVSNVSYSGGNSQAGTIDIADPAVVSFNHGIIMSSGDISNAVGPNKSDSITGYIGGGSDADLTNLIANSATVNPMTYDAASLSFDFVPTASTVYFTYTFASDEYLEWVNLFNDVFAFYVNGTNCATVPNPAGGSNLPVSIDSINSAVNTNLFRDNSFSNPPANPLNIEYDGLSVEMICSANVNPGVTNHMKLAIADTSDGILDTAVMIKAQSLSTTPPESCNNGVDDNGDGKVDMDDTICKTTTTPAPQGQSGVGGTTTAPLPLPPVALTPIAYSGAPAFTGNEGTPILLDPAALGWKLAKGTYSTTWAVTGINGNTATCEISPSGPQSLNPDGSVKLSYAVCPKDGEYVAHIWGWECGNAKCGSSDDYDVDFFVHNAPPTSNITEPSASGSADVTAGTPVTLTAAVADPGDDPVTCSVTWGDGTTGPATYDPNTQTCAAQNTYSAPSPQGLSIASANQVVATMSATDNQGATSASAIVLNIGAAGSPNLTPQNLSFNTQPPSNASYGDSFSIDAISDANLPVTLSTDGGCTLVDTTVTMTSGTVDCQIYVDQAGDSTYDAAPQLTATVYATPAQLTVEADYASKIWGATDPGLSYQITSGSLQFGDSITGDLSRAVGEDPGSYFIDQGSLDAGSNYAISFVGNWFDINGYAPYVTLDPKDNTVAAGTPITLQVSGDASPAASIRWQKMQTDGSFSDIAGATSDSFSAPTAASDDGAAYRAVFSNGLGESATNFATISVVSISSVSPASAMPGQPVTISGTGLSNIDVVRFVGAQTNAIISADANSLTVNVPVKARSGQVTAVQPGISVTSSQSLVITKPAAVPKVTSLWPRSAAAGATVTISGTNLTGTTAVSFGSVVSPHFVLISSTRILAVVPTDASNGPIQLSNPAGNAATAAFSLRKGLMTPKVGAVHLVSVTPHSSATLLLTGLQLGSATSIKLNGVSLDFTALTAEKVLITVPITGQNISSSISPVIVSNGVTTSQNTKRMKVLGWQ